MSALRTILVFQSRGNRAENNYKRPKLSKARDNNNQLCKDVDPLDSYIHSVFFFFIRTSNFGAEAERSYIFLRFEAENVLKMFLNYMVYTTCISVNSMRT